MKKLSYEYVKQYIENEGYILLSDSYISNSIKLKMICPCGHECEISFGNFKDRNRRCSKCYGNKKLNKQEIEEMLLSEGYTLISDYKNANTKILLLCPKGHQWDTTWGKFQSKRRCPYCSGKFNNHKTIQEMIESEDGYKLLTNDCRILKDRLIVCCKFGHKYETTGANFSQGHRCPYCNKSKGEDRIKSLLNKYNIYSIEQYSFDDCKFYNKLLFDFYLPQYNTCIEYDGEFHYKMIMGFDEFVNGKIRDTIKNEYCKKNNIKLIRIPYWKFDNIEEILIKELNLK